MEAPKHTYDQLEKNKTQREERERNRYSTRYKTQKDAETDLRNFITFAYDEGYPSVPTTPGPHVDVVLDEFRKSGLEHIGHSSGSSFGGMIWLDNRSWWSKLKK